jgi:hypothetical protein
MSEMSKKEKKSTDELLKGIRSSSDFSAFMKVNNGSFIGEEHFVTYLNDLIKNKGFSKGELIKRAKIERTYGFHILNGSRKPGRDKVIQLAIGLELGVDETQMLLKISGNGELYPRVMRDAAILFCLKNRFDMIDTQLFLDKQSFKTLGE